MPSTLKLTALAANIISLCATLSFSTLSFAAEKASWEIGAGITTFSAPDYRGSNESRQYTLPIPYLVYKGEFLTVDGDISGKLLASDRVKLDISIAGTLPVDSEKNKARIGMTDLDPIIEAGPSLQFLLSSENDSEIWFDMNLRTAIAAKLSSFEQHGLIFNPRIRYKNTFNHHGQKWKLQITAGPLFADKTYHNYFYAVSPAQALANRSAFSARSGYSGFSSTASLTRRWDKWWLGSFIRYDNLSNAVFEDSPLVKQNSSLIAGIALTRIFASSK